MKMTMRERLKSLMAYLGICFHVWGEWGGEFQNGWSDYQRRKCSKCGKIEQRYIGWSRD